MGETCAQTVPVPLDPRREGVVTGSSVAAVVGEDPYDPSGKELLRKKLLHLQSEDTPATLHGKRYESLAMRAFIAQTHATITYPGYVQHPVYGWLAGTVDGFATFEQGATVDCLTEDGSEVKHSFEKGSKAVVEIKCPLKRAVRPNDLPTQYIGQVQTYMEILDVEFCVFVQFKPPGPRSAHKYTQVAVARDRHYMRLRLSKLFSFWMRMTIGKSELEKAVTTLQRAWRDRAHRGVPMRNRLSTLGSVLAVVRMTKKSSLLEDPSAVPNNHVFAGVLSVDVSTWGARPDRRWRAASRQLSSWPGSVHVDGIW